MNARTVKADGRKSKARAKVEHVFAHGNAGGKKMPPRPDKALEPRMDDRHCGIIHRILPIDLEFWNQLRGNSPGSALFGFPAVLRLSASPAPDRPKGFIEDPVHWHERRRRG